MNYRHAFHAGNHADVLKHIVLTRLLALMSRKEQPFAYLDTHAGIGLYDLRGDEASRTGEWIDGIGRLWDATDLPPAAAGYMEVLRHMNRKTGELRYYPGSPELARRLSREQDRVLLNEKHPDDGVLLKDNMKFDRRVAVHLGEGWHVPRALLPVSEKRAVMLIDPPFEQLDELKRCSVALKETFGRMRQTVAALWYPIKDPRLLRGFYQDLAETGAPKLLRVELYVHPLDTPASLNGSGLAIANPPWGLEEELRELLPYLAEKLGQTKGDWKMDWLIAE
ncbi:23S rRNA (adenine(2030)-N(6))-methyltransferase RlmJ [Pseudomonas syringae]|nr:23S rRNA (adenine(2030)-N(6))-methyltransferase RlmJ [Pseudomonas syringae]MBD8575626.1 23S rRNA (adenine(2030)-N(6))-methyltransferase RlmJ [Pseudomonas syringae]MBD8788595.1 23S rRNA (adenine(2030)-N(6))-methyltransferase RlmJ [Pseudomonas syringae]MBD8801653.1 23S rRNA (adenine(2030)-N(6))-methyltransferase RlmJ [Pseudomonas syringae]MBD8811402.1 23S rRNA (adenine(2030)-N(6))-methyltransferase RlmJ [Pseudomonas syringae]